MAVLFFALPATATESHSTSFSNISLDAGYVSSPPQPNVSFPSGASNHGRQPVPPAAPAPLETAAPAVEPPNPPPARWPRLLAALSVLIAAVALATRRRTRRQANEAMAVAAHELKSPLAALESYLALMEQEGKSGAAADKRAWLEDVARMRSTAAHLRRTIGDILEMTHLDDARVKLEPRSMDLADSAREATAAFQAMASESGIHLKLSAGRAPAWGDPTRVRQILDNLVSNALRHTPTGGKVTVSTGSDDDGRSWCTVVDSGKGVPLSQRARLFGRFTRLSPPVRGKAGTGLGLYIGRTLARAQRGALEYETAPGAHGGRFRLTLPQKGKP